MTKRSKEKLAGVEMDCLRRACRVSRLHYLRNEMLKKLANFKGSINGIVEQRRLIYGMDIYSE